MENDAVMDEVDNELVMLQTTLKDRLKETTELSDLDNDVFKNTLSLEKHTSTLETTARATKWKWLFEYAKWFIIGGVIVTLLVIIILKPLLK